MTASFSLLLAMNLLGVTVEGRDNRAIQAAVDRVAAAGGGEVRLPAGVYQMDDSLHIRSRVHVRGEGTRTILKMAAGVSSPLSADLGYGHYDISLAQPEKFRVGMGVHIHDDRSGGFYDTVATLTWRDGDRFGISRMLNHDYGRYANAVVSSSFPVVSGNDLEDASVEDLAIDGNKAENRHLGGCRGGGVFLLQAHKVTLRNLTVRNYNGDGISFQQCRRTTVENCIVEGMTGLGLHPGSGSVGTVLRGNTTRNNGTEGIFYCLRVSFSLCEGNTIENNGTYGISIGGRDTDHLLRKNTIRNNGKAGIHFRNHDAAMAGSRNQLENNVLENNCRKEGPAEIEILGATSDIHILANTIRPGTRAGKSLPAIWLSPQVQRIVIFGNEVEGRLLADNAGSPGAVSLNPPARQLAVGPECLGEKSAIHLSSSTQK